MAEPGDPDIESGSYLSIGELAERLAVPTHVLRYWETRFPELKPIQRSGRRRFYSPDDVAVATRIKALLHDRGLTVDSARRAIAGGADDAAPVAAASGIDVARLEAIRDRLKRALSQA